MKKGDHQIVQQVLDGDVSRESFDAFQQRMRGEPDLVRFYGEYARLHHTLSEEYEDTVPSLGAGSVTGEKPRSLVLWLLGAMIVLLPVLAFYWESRGKGRVAPPVTLADVRFSDDAVWRAEGISGSPEKHWGMSSGATLEIMQGVAEVVARNGSKALIEGPASLTLVSGNSLHLASGRGAFSSGSPSNVLSVTTPSMTAEATGAEFGVAVYADNPDELHVFKGLAKMRVNGSASGETLEESHAGKVSGPGTIERIPAAAAHFPHSFHLFRDVVSSPFAKSAWRVEHGAPSIEEDRIGGENFAVFMKLPEVVPTPDDPVMLVTFTVGQPAAGAFHTDGWAGISFFKQGTELLFFGDSFGPEPTWSLDVKQRIPVILPGKPVNGPRTITLRYDGASGDVSLHEGKTPLAVAFCSGKLAPGTAFDEIRLGASSSAALTVNGLRIQTGGGR
ncbi:MAG: hypothetical protein EOP88_12825 [Verrucomicrobiaceae bacterium]|nr:MAG: hypothetical protein EOP88_12825 [Verrucomicrobiaceae bacterium]